MRFTTRPAGDGGSAAVGVEVLMRVVDVVPVGVVETVVDVEVLMRVVDLVPLVAVETIIDVGPFEGAVGVFLGGVLRVAELAAVADVVGPAVGFCGEDPQAATSSSTTNAVTLAPRTDVRTIAHSSRRFHCPPTGSGME
jgi:hypothetical protein